jgi:hypothetical protein
LSKQKRFSHISEKELIELQEAIDNQWKKLAAELACQDL